MNETDFQELFMQWKASGDSEKFEAIKQRVHRFIYEYPRTRFFVEEDIVSEFYAEYAGRVEEFIENYDTSYNVPFLIYMKVMIRRRFWNFLVKRNKNKKFENYNEYYEIHDSVHHNSVFERRAGYGARPRAAREEAIEYALSLLKPDEELVVRIYYGFPLGLGHLRLMARYNRSCDLFMQYRVYRDMVEKWFQNEAEQKRNISERLNCLDFELKILESSHWSVYQGKNKRKNKLIRNYYSLRHEIPLKQISKLLNRNVSFVYRRLQSGRKKLFEQLSDALQHFSASSRKPA